MDDNNNQNSSNNLPDGEQDDIIVENFDDNNIVDGDEESTEKITAKFAKLKEVLKQCQTEKREYLDGWQRSKADFINHKKTVEKEREDIVKFSKTAIILELLEVVDGFNMAFGNKEAWEKVDQNWRTGVQYIYNKLMAILKDNGMEEINTSGRFNALEHQSVGTEPVTKEEDDELVVKVFQKGYKLNQKVIRPAKVIIGVFDTQVKK